MKAACEWPSVLLQTCIQERNRNPARTEKKEGMVRPSADSLNSLAQVLRRAEPIYTECRSILNYLDGADGRATLAPIEVPEGATEKLAAGDDALITHRTVLELEPRVRRRIM
jgi:hypothetical protein